MINRSLQHYYSPNELRSTGYATGLRSWLPRRFVIDQTSQAVLVVNGVPQGPVGPGEVRIRPRTQKLVTMPATNIQLNVAGQEMLTADGAGVRATVSAVVKIVDPVQVVANDGWHDPFYLDTQLVLRNTITARSLEEVLAQRSQFDVELNLALAPMAERHGVELVSVALRDLVVPGELKRAVADVVAARLSGQAALERARAESAALRSLNNAARAVADNPALLQLRLVQQMEQSHGNTYVLGSVLPVGGD